MSGELHERGIALSEAVGGDERFVEFYDGNSCRTKRLYRARVTLINLIPEGRNVAAELLGA